MNVVTCSNLRCRKRSLESQTVRRDGRRFCDAECWKVWFIDQLRKLDTHDRFPHPHAITLSRSVLP